MNRFLHSSPGLILIGILVISGVFQVYGAFHDSGTMDELAHIPAGYGYAKYQDFRLNPEHPPLLKLLSILLLPADGSTGLDLSFATHLFMLEKVKDPALESQIVSRAHRMGATGPVQVQLLQVRSDDD